MLNFVNHIHFFYYSSFSTGPFGSMVHKSDYVSTNGTPIINPANIVNGRILNKGIKKVSNDKVVELTKYRLSENDILLARRGDLAKCAIVTNSHVNSLCGTGTFFLHLIFVLPQYFKYVYSSNLVQDILKKDCVGATMDNLNQSVLANIYIPIPPLEEQMRINKRLEYYFSLLNLVEDEGNSLQATIQQAKSKILDLAIHGKLVPQNPNDEPASELLKRINPKAETTCDNPQYGKLPDTWAWTTLGEITNYGDNKSVAVENIDENDWILELEDLEKDSADIIQVFTKKQRRIKGIRHSFNKGNIIYSKLRTYLNKVLVAPNDGFCTTEMIAFDAYEQISNDYICYVLRSKYFVDYTQQCGYGVKMPRLSTADACKGFIPLPPINEQQRIVVKIEELFAQLDKIESSL